MSSRLFVGNVNPKLTRRDLEKFFSEAGDVVAVSIPLDRETREPRGFAFVEFRTSEQATEAIESLQNADLEGRRIRLRPAYEDKRRDSPSRRPERSPTIEAYEPAESPIQENRYSHDDDAYSERRHSRPQKRGKHGSDRKRGRGTRRRLD
ncbi:MAG: RNA-binding protein [Acidobacteriota bacterium]